MERHHKSTGGSPGCRGRLDKPSAPCIWWSALFHNGSALNPKDAIPPKVRGCLYRQYSTSILSGNMPYSVNYAEALV